MHRIRPVVFILAMLLAASPALAYVVYLKDGQQIVTKEAPKVEGDQAVLLMRNGTTTSIATAEIDFAKTEEVNKVNLGSATILESHNREIKPETKPEKRMTVGDLIAERRLGLAPPETAEPEPAVGDSAVDSLPKTRAGYIDLVAMNREIYRQTDITGEVLQYLQGQGFEGSSIFQGSREGRALLEISANSEAAVFKALRESANAFIQSRERFPGKLEAIELLLVTDKRLRAGQFLITPERATQLASGQIEPPVFFLRYVEY